jgi:hypothetical protein
LSTQKLIYDEQLQRNKVRIRQEEEKKQEEIEDHLRIAVKSKDELEVKHMNVCFVFVEHSI